jgi:hypothetical protein
MMGLFIWQILVVKVQKDCIIKTHMLSEKMDRTQVIIAKKDALDKADDEYWQNATAEEKLQTITFLRECFYGEEATTGRLQRFYTITKLK